jgi:UDP-N-acetylmuramate--alanine ligase
MSVITSVDPDHLDIYGTPEAYREAFSHYTSLITGALVVKKDLPFDLRLRRGVKCYTYAVGDDEADFYADNIRVLDAKIYFDFHTPTETLSDLRLGVPVWVNIENSVAAMAVAWLNGVSAHELRSGLSSFSGVWRRFNVHVHTPHVAYIDDYAHHPQELRASVESIRRLFPDRYSIVIFQPHLYTRTRDFLEEFAEVLSRADEVILLPIYPARELPIPGVTSDALLSLLTSRRRQLVEKDELVQTVVDRIHEIDRPVAVMTLGAGDIDRLVPAMKKALLKA